MRTDQVDKIDKTAITNTTTSELDALRTITESKNGNGHSTAHSFVLKRTGDLPADLKTPCRGHDFSITTGIDDIMNSFLTTGFQATNLALAAERIREMRQWRLAHVPFQEGIDDPDLRDESIRKRIRCRIFLAYTSNQISSGQREVIRFLVQNKMVDVIITTTGAIEEDIIKCFSPTYMGDFSLKGKDLREQGINRIGNLIIPNTNYCQFEDWLMPVINAMHDEQDDAARKWAKHVANIDHAAELPPMFHWTPSQFIHRLGKVINNEDSVLYWAARNNIPVFSPALTDGSVGDMIHFHSYRRPGFVLDIAEDIRRINDLAIKSHCTGQIILGGGLVKHHTCNANLMRNGADYSIYINTASDYDGSDTGASPDEAVSWGKVRFSSVGVVVSVLFFCFFDFFGLVVWPCLIFLSCSKTNVRLELTHMSHTHMHKTFSWND